MILKEHNVFAPQSRLPTWLLSVFLAVSQAEMLLKGTLFESGEDMQNVLAQLYFVNCFQQWQHRREICV